VQLSLTAPRQRLLCDIAFSVFLSQLRCLDPLDARRDANALKGA
jgi:hypothetical protein